ncbi:MAG: response regulator transcription factor [Clostridiales Family XIII bacterium]|jgi:DNA-binding response OmpR family regulator|nr:response regulator transcription factor [Clostridiales Family XIII bacterium]
MTVRNILIVEDDKILRRELGTLLEKHGYGVITTDDFAHIVEFALAQNPQLILLDLNLPFHDGHYLCRELRKQSKIPIIVVTSSDSEMDELMSLNLGADQFVTKPYNTRILLAKISALMNRVYDMGASGPLRFGELALDAGRGTIFYRGNSAELTRNELRILRILMENQGKIVSRDDIMIALWQSDAFVDDNTLTVNINRLRRKLDTLGAKELLKTRRGQGYSL